MIDFLSEAVEREFQLLPIAMQLEYYDIAMSFLSSKRKMTILCVDIDQNDEANTEISVRIDPI